MKNPILNVKEIYYTINGLQILKKVSMFVKSGEFVGVIGPNGSGKSTLLKNISKIISPNAGHISLNNINIAKMAQKNLAKELSVVSQENNTSFDFTVTEVVSMGRYPHKKMTESLNNEDKKIVENALLEVGMTAFANSSFLNLSGGEKQKVLIARALAQDTQLVILDEPTNHLDIGSQTSMLKIMKNSGKTVVAALHDLSVALKYCDRIYVMKEGRVVCEGVPQNIICPNLIENLYGVKSNVFSKDGKTFIDYE